MAKSSLKIILFLALAVLHQAEMISTPSMEGRHLKAAVWEVHSFINFMKFTEQMTTLTYIRDSDGNVVGYSGVTYELLVWLSKKLQFTYTIIPVFEYKAGPFPNGTWIGVHELIRKKEVDFTPCSINILPSVHEIMDFTATSAEMDDVFLVAWPEEESRLLTPIKPFTLAVWVLILGCVTIVSIAIYVIVNSDKRISRKRRQVPQVRLNDAGLTVIGVTFGQSEFPAAFKQSEGMRVMLSLFCLALVVLVNSYTGTFISFATSPKLLPLAEEAEEVAFRSGLRYIGVSYQDLNTFTLSTNRPFKKFGESLGNLDNIYPTYEEASEVVATGCCTYLFPRAMLHVWLAGDLKRHGRCRCTVTNKPILWDFYSLGCQKRSTYCQTLSKGLLLAKEMGLTTYWWSKQLEVPYACLHPEKPKIRRLNVADLSGVFLVFLGGVAFSIIVFVLEVVKGKWKH